MKRKKKIIQLIIPCDMGTVKKIEKQKRRPVFMYEVEVIEPDGFIKMGWNERRYYYVRPEFVESQIRKQFEISEVYRIRVKILEQ